MKILKYFPGIW